MSAATPIRVLFWIRRRSAPRGGDLVALEHTIGALRARNVVCDISDDPAHDLAPYTLVHLYNLTDANVDVEYVSRAVNAGKPLVTTPIYWSHAQWFQARLHATPTEHPEFFLGNLTPEQRTLSQRILELSEARSCAAHHLVCEAAARIFVLSRGESNVLAREFHVPREKMRVSYYGVDPSFASGDAERFIAAHGLRDFILCAARIEERKNTTGIIRAWRDETMPLVFAGHASDPLYLELCKREAGPNVHFIGSLAPSALADAYAAAHVHVMASWWEEVGLSALEAGLAGCNLVMTQNGPAHEYVGDAAFVCDPGNLASIRAAMRAAYDAPRQTHLRDEFLRRFTWENSVTEIYNAYSEIAANPARFQPRVSAAAWQQVSEPMAELLHLREEYLHVLETRARETAAWAHELETIIAVRDAERARWLPWTRLAKNRRQV